MQILIVLITIMTWIAQYILFGIAMLKIGEKVNLSNNWLQWIPGVRYIQLGKFKDELEKIKNSKITKEKIKITTISFINIGLNVFAFIYGAITLIKLFMMFSGIITPAQFNLMSYSMTTIILISAKMIANSIMVAMELNAYNDVMRIYKEEHRIPMILISILIVAIGMLNSNIFIMLKNIGEMIIPILLIYRTKQINNLELKK